MKVCRTTYDFDYSPVDDTLMVERGMIAISNLCLNFSHQNRFKVYQKLHWMQSTDFSRNKLRFCRFESLILTNFNSLNLTRYLCIALCLHFSFSFKSLCCVYTFSLCCVFTLVFSLCSIILRDHFVSSLFAFTCFNRGVRIIEYIFPTWIPDDLDPSASTVKNFVQLRNQPFKS